MFLKENENSEEIKNFLQSEKTKCMAVAFIGSGIHKIIAGDVRIVCNLMSGATNPKEVEALTLHPNIKIKNCSYLHAKVYISEGILLVGSANLSTNGLGLENESAGWLEASLIEKNKETIDFAQSWFDSLWEKSEEITPTMLDFARQRFFCVRKHRPPVGLDLNSLQDRDFYCVLYKDINISMDAEEVTSTNIGDDWKKQGYGIYEQWGEKLPKGNLIDFHMKKNGNIKYIGTWKYDEISFKSNKTDIQIAKEVKNIDFDVDKLKEVLMAHLNDLWPNHQTEKGVVIYINDVLKFLNRAE